MWKWQIGSGCCIKEMGEKNTCKCTDVVRPLNAERVNEVNGKQEHTLWEGGFCFFFVVEQKRGISFSFLVEDPASAFDGSVVDYRGCNG